MTDPRRAAGDPEPPPGAVLPRLFGEAPAGQTRAAVEQSSAWSRWGPDGSEVTTEVDGPPLADPRLRSILQSLFPEAAEEEPAPPAVDDRPILRVTWKENGRDVATATLHADGQLVIDDGTGPRRDRHLSSLQLDHVHEALTAANLAGA